MYTPSHFAITDPAVLHDILRTHPLGMLVTTGTGPEASLEADHLPFAFDPDQGPLGTLTAHVARANPIWQRNAGGSPVMVVFRGVEGYVSPNWYPSKHETHRQVPTWNYVVAHAHGTLTIRDDPRFVRSLLARLTRTHEAREPRPWSMADAPPDFIAQRLAEIVGIEITLTRLEGKAKLSQNREARDRQGVIAALEALGQSTLAQAVARPPR